MMDWQIKLGACIVVEMNKEADFEGSIEIEDHDQLR